MGRLFGWLDREYVETIEEYDNRVNQLPEIHAGYVFFDWMNYRGYARSFSVFIEWNGELNHKLQDAMPQGGYCFRCTPEEAASLINNHNGIPIYIKLYAKCGRLYVKQLYFKRGDSRYEIHFNGCEVAPPDMVCFVGLQNYSSQQGILSLLDYKEPDKNEDSEKKWWTGSGHAVRGSYKIIRGKNGSYRRLQRSSYQNFLGSYRGLGSSYFNSLGSYRSLNGSYQGFGSSYRNLWGGYIGSYYGITGSYKGMLGSYRMFGGSYGSFYRNFQGGSYGKLQESSYRNFLGSYWSLGGSYRGYSGSYGSFRGSYRNLSGSYRGLEDSDNEKYYQRMNYEPELHTEEVLEEIQIDGALGYGLDLI